MSKKRRRPPAAAPSRAKADKADKAEQEERRRRREDRLRAEERARAARERRALAMRVGPVAVAAIAVVTVVGIVVANRRSDAALTRALTAGSCTYDTKTDPGNTGQHADQVSFRVDPPAGGVHLPSAASPGSYSAANRPPDGQLVHAMEHGDIVLWHRPDLPEADIARLEALLDRDPKDVLVVPRDSLTVAVAATAWHRRLLCPSIDEPALSRFVREFKDKGPEKLPE